MDVSSLVSMVSLTIVDYFSWTNVCKLLVVLFCINGLVLQIILLTIQYFSYEMSIDLQLISDEDRDQTSATICLPLVEEEVLRNSETNETFIFRQRVRQLSDVFSKSVPKISCSSPLKSSIVCENPVQSYDNSYKCFTFVFDSEIQLSVNWSHTSDQNSYRVSIHSTKTYSNSFESDFRSLSLGKSHELRFWSFHTKQLTSPYTMCQTYHKSETRSQCLHNCIVSYLKTFCPNCVPKEVFILESDFSQSMRFCPKHECNEDFQSLFSDCRLDCLQV